MFPKQKLSSHAKEWALLPFFTFLILKNILKRNTILSSQKVLTICLCSLLTILALLVSLPCLLLMILVKKLVEVLIKYEDLNFHSMMASSDVMWCVDNNSTATINILAIVESNSDGLEVYKTFQKTFSKAWKEHSKVHCTREQKYGYYYWRQLESYDEKAFITTYDKYDSMDDWNKFMDQAAISPMPLDNKTTIHLTVGLKDLKWKASEDADIRYYPLFIRCHHSFGDGASVMNFIVTQFFQDGVEAIKNYLQSFSSNVLKKKLAKQPRKTNIMDRIKEVVNADFKFLAFMDSFSNSFVPTKKLGDVSFLCYFSEQDHEISNKIDDIRRKYDLSFTKLMLVLVEESLAQLYASNKIKKPEDASTMLTCMTAMLKSLELKDNVCLTNDGHPVVNLSNSFSMGLYKNSIKTTTPSGVQPGIFTKIILEKAKVLGEELDLLNKSVDFQFIKWMIDFTCSSMPWFVISAITDIHKNPFAVTNLPGMPVKPLLKASNPKIQQSFADLIYWMPQYKTTGMGLILSKYAGNVKMTFLCNCAYIEKKENAELFIKNILKNIDTLHETI